MYFFKEKGVKIELLIFFLFLRSIIEEFMMLLDLFKENDIKMNK